MDNAYVTEKLQEQNFQILDMTTDPETEFLVLTVVHNIHPDIEFNITLITKDASGDDTMEMQFNGPDDFTDEEAKQILQEIMDVLINIIKTAVEDGESIPVEDEIPIVPPEGV